MIRGGTIWACILLVVASLASCSDDDPSGTGGAGAAGATGGGGDGGGGSPATGTMVLFDLDADLSERDSFYHLPYPLDLRLTADGKPDLTGFPWPTTPVAAAALTLAASAADRPGFPKVPAGYFQFDGPVAPQVATDTMAASIESPVLLVDIDPDSPDQGTLYPTIAYTPPADEWCPEHLLAVASFPGFVLREGVTYAFVVQRSLGDAEGEPLGVHPALAQLAAGETPDGAMAGEVQPMLEPLWSALDDLGVDRTAVAAATVFTVGELVRETHEMSEHVLADHDVAIDDLALDPDDGTTHPRFCELHGSITVPLFQKGTPPFDTEGGIEVDADGAPIQQGTELAPIAISIPKQEMPTGGYPLVLYIHGSGGISTQLVDRGKILVPDGEETPGEGPAHVLGEHGFAVAGSAMPINPERVPGAGSYDYINFSNPGAFPYTFRQGLFEQRLFIEALADLTIDPAVLAGCDGVSLPGGQTAYRFDVQPLLVQGQSMGSWYANMLSTIEPIVGAVVPTGAGGFYSYFIPESLLYGDLKPLASGLLGIPLDSMVHIHPGLYMLQTSWEPGDPIAYIPMLARRPLPDHPVRSVYTPVGPEDTYFAESNYNAMAMAYGNQQAGDVIWSDMQDSLALAGLDGIQSYPVQHNVTSENGTPYTGVTVQYEGDGIVNSHSISTQLDDVKYQYGCFFATFRQSGTAVVPAPAALGTPCPQ